MNREWTSVIALVAFLNYIIFGCAPKREYKILNEEFNQLNYSERIISAVLKNGKAYRFSPYATFKEGHYSIKGLNDKEEKISFDFNNIHIKEIRTSRPEIISLDAVTGIKINEILFLDNTIHKANGGLWQFIRSENRLLSIRGGEIIDEFSADSIKEVRISTPTVISKKELSSKPKTLVQEMLLGNKLYTFAYPGGTLTYSNSFLTGTTMTGATVSIAEEDILYVNVHRVDAMGAFVATIGVFLLVVGIIALIALATKQSCPFVYSYSGEKYVFDAEPLGGSVARGLQKTDYSRLEHLQNVNGKYQIIFRNEVRETQYLDEIKLLVIDHDEDSSVIPDSSGNFYEISNAVGAENTYDEMGKDLSPFLNDNDDVSWQTYLPKGETKRISANRHQITLTFPKPKDARYANLIFNGGTAAWGSNMIRKMLELRGDHLDEWYQGINRHGPEYEELLHFILREELYLLKFYFKNNDQWTYGGFLTGGGPLITEDRITPIDLTEIKGDQLMIRLYPPPTFWQINYLAIDYQPTLQNISYQIPVQSAVDQDESDITDFLSAADDHYHQMSEVGNWFKAEFVAPPKEAGKSRSIFLETTGYYELHIDKTKPEETILIKKLLSTPGEIVKYSIERYLEWYHQQFAAN